MWTKIIALGIATFLAGGAVLLMASTAEPKENPLFVAWFESIPSIAYDHDTLEISVAVVNAEPKKTFLTPTGVDSVGESGTHDVCLVIDGATASCQSASLDHGERTRLSFHAQQLAEGNHTIQVKNATHIVRIAATPQVGEWVNHSAVSIRLVRSEQNGTAWDFAFQIAHENASVPLEVMVKPRFAAGHPRIQGGGSDAPLPTQWSMTLNGFISSSENGVVQLQVVARDLDPTDGIENRPLDAPPFRWLVG